MRTGLKLKLLFQYVTQKSSFVSLLTLEKYEAGEIALEDVWNTMKKLKMTYFCRIKGSEMEPSISPRDALVVRKLPFLTSRYKEFRQEINVGDIVVLKDPMDSRKRLVRRLAAVEGYEMVSTNKDDEPFVIERDQAWVLCDNKNLEPKECNDSRTYGPISMSDIVGRVIFRYQTNQNNEFMFNSKLSVSYDLPLIYLEIDSEKLIRFADKGKKNKSS